MPREPDRREEGLSEPLSQALGPSFPAAAPPRQGPSLRQAVLAQGEDFP